MLGDSSAITLPKEKNAKFIQLLHDRHFLLLTGCAYCVRMAREGEGGKVGYGNASKTELVKYFPNFRHCLWFSFNFEMESEINGEGRRAREKEIHTHTHIKKKGVGSVCV